MPRKNPKAKKGKLSTEAEFLKRAATESLIIKKGKIKLVKEAPRSLPKGFIQKVHKPTKPKSPPGGNPRKLPKNPLRGSKGIGGKLAGGNPIAVPNPKASASIPTPNALNKKLIIKNAHKPFKPHPYRFSIGGGGFPPQSIPGFGKQFGKRGTGRKRPVE